MNSANMSMDDYQQLAERTANTDLPYEMQLATAALGLAGEAGEVADSIKKNLGHGHTLDPEHIRKELGDIQWYVSRLAYLLGYTLGEVAEENILKLQKRYPDGFSDFRSINRADDEPKPKPIRGTPEHDARVAAAVKEIKEATEPNVCGRCNARTPLMSRYLCHTCMEAIEESKMAIKEVTDAQNAEPNAIPINTCSFCEIRPSRPHSTVCGHCYRDHICIN